MNDADPRGGAAGPGRPGRRRFIAIAGSTALAAALPAGRAAAAGAPLHRWSGIVLGARASLAIAGLAAPAAGRLIAECRREIARLEGIFSLYRPDSALSRLNRTGALDAPPAELRALLALVQRIHRAGGGAFDPTVQPLWQLYAAHFARRPEDRTGPPQPAIDRALARVGWRHVRRSGGRISFGRPGMALTLNGIAQGYIGDRVARLMRRRGLAHALVDLGEIGAVGGHPAGRPWRVGIARPGMPGEIATTLSLSDAAVATSGEGGTHFDGAGRFGHILDPRTGRPVRRYASLSVVAPSAAVADGLSTAGFLLPPAGIRQALARFPGTSACAIDAGGHLLRLTAAS